MLTAWSSNWTRPAKSPQRRTEQDQRDWDENKLALLIADLDAADFDAELTGFDDDEIQR
nr:hypothetical protein [Trueperella pyogenes]